MAGVAQPIDPATMRTGLRTGVRSAWIDAGVAAIVLAMLAWGWRGRADPALDPHGWAGWSLGLIGALMMLAVLGFSWAKRCVPARGSVPGWYNAHILLGLLGPVLILIHARFGWGSINSSFALVAMGLVVGSGLLARYALGPARRSGNPIVVMLGESWHYLHLPLYGVLVMATALHVYMAHAY